MAEPIPPFMDYLFERGVRTKSTYNEEDRKRLDEMQRLKDFIALNKNISDNIGKK